MIYFIAIQGKTFIFFDGSDEFFVALTSQADEVCQQIEAIDRGFA